jgi:hypothetical protein
MKYTRKQCWDKLTENVRVGVGRYVIDPKIFHEVKAMLFAKADKCKHEYDLECDNKALVCRKCGKFRPKKNHIIEFTGKNHYENTNT